MPEKTQKKRKAKDSEEISSSSGQSHGSTLFVSNLPYNATSTDLQTAFSDLAPVRFAFVVLEHESGVSKGVGYVSFSIKEDAQTVFESIQENGLTINGRRIRVQWAESKKTNKTKERLKTGDTAKEKETFVPRSRVQKVDNPSPAESSASTSDDSEPESEHEELGLHGDDTDDSEDEEGEDEDDYDDDSELPERDDGDELPRRPQLPPPDSGNTLFIRNIPFTATEDEVRTLFRAFGPLRYVRLTTDPETERPRGTGFACFWNKEDADKAISQGEILRAETMGGQMLPAKSQFSLSSLLTPDPSTGVAKNLVLHGRTLDVVRAVTREHAEKLKEDGRKSREKADKRNLYLLREGVILPNSPAAKTIPQVELEKRTNSFNARRTMLRSNPSLYVSRTRLSIRQIPLFATERVLKRLAIHSIREFNTEVKNGVREGLSPDELVEPVEVNEQDRKDIIKTEHDAKSKKRKGKSVRPTSVKQAKIVRQSDRVDPVTGKGRSRGYGFIELHTHADALRVLRWSNNNADIGALFDKWWKEELADLIKTEKGKESPDEARLKRMKDETENSSKPAKGTLIVEFSIENIQVIQRRRAQKEKPSQMHHLRKPAPHNAEGPPNKKRRVSFEEAKPVKAVRIKESVKPGKVIGSVIGRKRKARKIGKSTG